MNFLIGQKLKFDWKITTITIVSTLLLIVDAYHRITAYKHLDRFILYLIVPMILIWFVFRESLHTYGFGLGDWKAGLIISFAGILLMTPVLLYLGTQNTSMKEYYNTWQAGYPRIAFLDLVGWEFFFRGWILFGYARKFGPDALWLHAVPFALAHIGKPEVETLSTIFGGFAFGWVALRTHSFLYPLLIHWFIATFIVIVAAGVLG